MFMELKRTLKEENRIFNEAWELQYFLVNSGGKMSCFLCDTTIVTIKKFNAQQHYALHKDNKYAKLVGEDRMIALQKLKNGKQKQRQFFHSMLHQGNDATEASYKVAYLLGKNGKPFSDAELINECILKVVRCIDSDKVNKYEEVHLSRRTNTDRQHELARDVTEQLKNIIQKENVYYSIALDESTDSINSAQVLYFIYVITDDFQLYEELLALGTLRGKTLGIDIFNNFKEQCHKVELNINNLVSVCTDGAPAMMAKNEGFIAYLKREIKVPSALIASHCILHQQNLCAKSTILNDTLQKVIGPKYCELYSSKCHKASSI
ncbi:general transcription factor II-I repeat domain-containing protein 2-like [Centruroides sculpturatus]|uniref:general transcription factor II-I repeat domain-containing protein 2-like n=1 Tax=Centruroides sculpturatus TaxID=218467 RepID=UPI000C6DD86D|nr:general transcription factor II-I repeat domain-containing protein 2-like [Centruroides sculpturatus]